MVRSLVEKEVSKRSKSKGRVSSSLEVDGISDNSTNGSNGEEDLCAEYATNCERLGLLIDPSVYITLQTDWEVMRPSSRFAEGHMQPLIGVLERAKHIRKLNLENTTMVDSTFARTGNGNSNMRALASILKRSKHIQELNLRGTGLDDDGIMEVCRAISSNKSITTLNLAANDFGIPGAKALELALQKNNTLKLIDLTNNGLGFESIRQLECSCRDSGLVMMNAGNFVFEEILNSATHGIGFLSSVVGACVLMNASVEQGHATGYHYWACAVYSFSLMYLFLASTLYHSSFMLPRAHGLLQILDNIGIYMLIAGTYTPLLLIGLHNSPKAMILLWFQWLFAIACSMFTIYADLNHPLNNNIKLVSFLVMGSTCFGIFGEIMSSLPWDCLILYFVGGFLYVSGIAFFIMGETKPIYHAVWHLFVLAAAVVHWFATYHHIIGIDIRLTERIEAMFPAMHHVFDPVQGQVLANMQNQ